MWADNKHILWRIEKTVKAQQEKLNKWWDFTDTSFDDYESTLINIIKTPNEDTKNVARAENLIQDIYNLKSGILKYSRMNHWS